MRSSQSVVAAAADNASTKLDVAVLSQRIASMEDRLLSLEHLMTKTVSRVEQLVENQAADQRESQALFVRQREQFLLEQESLKQRLNAMEDVHRRDRSDAGKQADEMRSLALRLEAESKGERSVAAAEMNQRVVKLEQSLASATMEHRSTLANGMRTLQVFVRRQVESVASEGVVRSEQHEEEQKKLTEANRKSLEEVNNLREELAVLKSAQSDCDNTIRRQEQQMGRVGEEVNVLNRRVMSALRHLAHHDAPSGSSYGGIDLGHTAGATNGRLSPSAFRTTTTTTDMFTGSPAAATMASTAAPSMPTPAAKPAMPLHASPQRTTTAFLGGGSSSDEVDHFIRELGAMTNQQAML